MDFSIFANKIYNDFSKDQKETVISIKQFEKVKLASNGLNDTEGYQIFTPKFIVKQMIEAVGKDIIDFDKTVLEPTSGDGAFTTYVLIKRLETIKELFDINILKALSTIYSIEMDKELIEKQRNNIFTLIIEFCKKKKLVLDESFLLILKEIITLNFMWAMFNISSGGPLFIEVAYKMPEAEKGKLLKMDFPVWNINDESIEFHLEEVEPW